MRLHGDSFIDIRSSNSRVCGNELNGPGTYFTDSTNLLNTWYHLTFVLSGSSGRIYVNGNMTAKETSMPESTNIAKTWCCIGSLDQRSANVAIDELKFYNRALSEAEIRNDYNTNEALV